MCPSEGTHKYIYVCIFIVYKVYLFIDLLQWSRSKVKSVTTITAPKVFSIATNIPIGAEFSYTKFPECICKTVYGNIYIYIILATIFTTTVYLMA